MNSVLSRMGRIYGVLRKTHHIYVIPFFLAGFFAFLRTVVAIAMAADNLFFWRLARTKASRPIVLVGNPRTGTTFLQRFLSDNGFGAGMELFLMLYPSLLLQKMLRPILPILEKLSPAKFHQTEAHATSLGSVETDDVGVLFRYLDGFFLYGFFLTFEDEDCWQQFDPRVRDTSARDYGWLDKLWRRSLVLHKADRNIAKLFTVSVRMPSFLAAFPEAQVLYMARDPLAIIPSAFSLVVGALDRAFGFWKLPEDVRKRWFDRMYAGLIILLKRFHEDWTSGAIDKSRVYIVRYDRMMLDLENVMEEMCTFLKHEMTPELRAVVKAQAEKQRAYESEHKYKLDKYGLTEEQIRKDCAFFYDTFLPPWSPGGEVAKKSA